MRALLHARLHDDRGSVSLLVVIMVPALLMAGGLVLDGGRQLQERRDAAAAAASAARAAAQMTEDEAFRHVLDPTLAAARGHAQLSTTGHAGEVVVDAAGVTVTVTATVDHLILPGSRTVSASSSSEPIDGITAEVEP